MLYFCSVLEMSLGGKLSQASKGVRVNKVTFLLKIMQISDEPLLSGQTRPPALTPSVAG